MLYINGFMLYIMVYNIGLKDEINMNFTVLLQHANRFPIPTVFQTNFFKITNTLEGAFCRKRPLNTLHRQL